MITGSKKLIRDMNSTLVLETIINKGPISRANIAKEVGLTKATISTIVSNLLARKLINEVGSDNTKLGRKPILLDFNQNAGFVIAINLGVHTINALQSNLMGREIQSLKVKTPMTNDEIQESLVSIINNLKERVKETPYGLVGITLGIHGVVKDNDIIFTPYYELDKTDLARYIGQHFSTRVYVENEANLSVLGETAFLPKYKNIVNINVHTGVGLGLLVEGELYTGFSGYAGELGHTIVEIDGKSCPCGNRGCLEQYLSEQALLLEFKKKKNLEYADFDLLSQMYKEGDQDAVDIFDDFIKYMTICVNNILNSYNPDIVIINSSFTDNYPDLIGQIEGSLNSRLNSVLNSALNSELNSALNSELFIYPSRIHGQSILLGGVSVGVKNFLEINNLNFVFDEFDFNC